MAYAVQEGIIRVWQDVAFDTPGIAAGVPILGYRPKAGDLVVAAGFVVPTLFDGTTPLGDLYVGGASTTGLLADYGTAWDLSAADVVSATGGTTQNQANQGLWTSIATAAGSSFPWITADAANIQIVISQTGLRGGAAIGGTAGVAIAYLVVLPFSPQVYEDQNP